MSKAGAGEPNTVKEWWTPLELAELKLPGMPTTIQNINKLADRSNWRNPALEWPANKDGCWRKRAGRGGGYEYRYDVLPSQARAKLMLMLRRAEKAARPDAKRAAAKSAVSSEERWQWYDRLPARAKAEAEAKLAALKAVEDLELTGTSRDIAIQLVAAKARVSYRSIYAWKKLVGGVPRADWLPALAPQRSGRTVKADCSPEAWDWFRSAYLRLERPTAAHVYRQLQAVAAEQGWTIPSRKTLERRIAALPKAVLTAARKGDEALKKLYPAQERDRSVFHALEAVNADGHKWDVFVKWPVGGGKFEIVRPVMVAFQDLYSGKILSWRVDRSENKECVRLAFGDLVETYGIPDHCWLDNGRNFASKWITGGAASRFRFRVKDEEPEGVMTALGVQVHWTTPYSGQSKPIERAFRDLAQNVARDHRFAGAWTGNTIDAKPENYASKAIDLDVFLAVVGEGIAEHNARAGRQNRVCAGRSFDETFTASYEASPIRRASEAQARLWLLAAEQVTARKPDGSVSIEGNRYWAEFLPDHIGRKLTLRLDPQNLHDGVHVYRTSGEYLGHAPCVEAVGFADADAARAHGRARREWMRGAKMQAAAEKKLSLDDLAALTPKVADATAPETKVIRPIFNGNTALRPAATIDAEHEQSAVLEDFGRAVARLRPIHDL